MAQHPRPARDSSEALRLAEAARKAAKELFELDPLIHADAVFDLAHLVALCVAPVSPRAYARHLEKAFWRLDQGIRDAFERIKEPHIGAAFHRVRHQVSTAANAHRYATAAI